MTPRTSYSRKEISCLYARFEHIKDIYCEVLHANDGSMSFLKEAIAIYDKILKIEIRFIEYIKACDSMRGSVSESMSKKDEAIISEFMKRQSMSSNR